MRLKEEVKELWKLCFNDSDEFVEMYFRLRYNSETTMTIENGNKIVASLQMPYYPMTLEGAEIQTAYISGACTHPDFRGKGVMAQLLAESFGRMVQKNITLSILIPANPGLYDYYSRTGYARAFFRSQIEQQISEIAISKENLHFEHSTTFEQHIFAYFTQRAYYRPNYVQHTAKDFEAVIEDLRIIGGDITIAYKNEDSSISGVLLAYPEDDHLHITEWFADSDGIRDQLIREAARYHQQSRVVRFELPNHSIHEKPFGMARIINAKIILHIYAASHPDQKINIHLVDKQLAFNSGYYYINKGTCTFSEEALENQHIEMNAQQLSALIFDQSRLYMSLMLE